VQAVPREAVRGEEGINKQICLAVSCVQPVFSTSSHIFTISLPAFNPPFTLLSQELKNIKKRCKPKGIHRRGWSKKNRKIIVTSMGDL
jgi:hypothetical protein